MEAPTLTGPELGPFPLCLGFGPPPGTNPQLWNLYIAGQLHLIVLVPEGSKDAPGPREVLTAEHPTYVRKPRKQSAFSDSVSKTPVHMTYHTWLPLLSSQRLEQPSTFMRAIGIFLFGVVVPGLGLTLPCDNLPFLSLWVKLV